MITNTCRFGMLFKCNVNLGDDSLLLIFNKFQVKCNESTLNARYGWYTCCFFFNIDVYRALNIVIVAYTTEIKL